MPEPAQRFAIVDLRIPFFRLVLFFIKAALAAIPAALFLAILLMLVTAVLAVIFDGGEMGEMMGRWRL